MEVSTCLEKVILRGEVSCTRVRASMMSINCYQFWKFFKIDIVILNHKRHPGEVEVAC